MGALTDFIFSLNDKDYIFFIIAVISAWTFAVVNNDKIYKIYFWIIVGFLLFQISNLEIKNILLTQNGLKLDNYQDFLLTNKDFVLSFFTCMIPVFWFSFVLSNSFSLKIKSSIGENLIFWFLFPFFFLWIFIFIFKNSALELVFLKDMLSPFTSSYIYNLLFKNLHYVSIFILFFIFYRLIITFVMAFFWFVIHFFGVKVLEKFWGWGGHEEEEKEESHSHMEEHHHG
jgi:hypothetical protein